MRPDVRSEGPTRKRYVIRQLQGLRQPFQHRDLVTRDSLAVPEFTHKDQT